MAYPQPKTGNLSGADGTIMRKGSAGRLAKSQVIANDPEHNDRCNESGIYDFNTIGDEVAYDGSYDPTTEDFG